jgi:hypothetical protein
LLSYTELDGRPAMRPFKVLREKPEAGITFVYRREAGTILQPPMPLPLMEKPFAPIVSGQSPKSLNTEIAGYVVQSSARSSSGVFSNHTIATTERHFLRAFEPAALQEFMAPSAP